MCLLGLCLFYSCYSGKSGFSFKFLMVNIFLKIYSFVITSIVRSLWFSTIVQFPLEWGGMWNVGLNEDQIRQHFCLTDSLTKAGAEWFVNGEKSKTKSYWLAGVKGAETMRTVVGSHRSDQYWTSARGRRPTLFIQSDTEQRSAIVQPD